MELRELKNGDYFIKATSKGRKNAQTYSVRTLPYINYKGSEEIGVFNMKKGTTGSLNASLIVIKIENWMNPFPPSKYPMKK